MQRRHSITPWDAGKGWGVLGWQICSAGLQLEQSTVVLSRGIAECLLASFPPPPPSPIPAFSYFIATAAVGF